MLARHSFTACQKYIIYLLAVGAPEGAMARTQASYTEDISSAILDSQEFDADQVFPDIEYP